MKKNKGIDRYKKILDQIDMVIGLMCRLQDIVNIMLDSKFSNPISKAHESIGDARYDICEGRICYNHILQADILEDSSGVKELLTPDITEAIEFMSNYTEMVYMWIYNTVDSVNVMVAELRETSIQNILPVDLETYKFALETMQISLRALARDVFGTNVCNSVHITLHKIDDVKQYIDKFKKSKDTNGAEDGEVSDIIDEEEFDKMIAYVDIVGNISAELYASLNDIAKSTGDESRPYYHLNVHMHQVYALACIDFPAILSHADDMYSTYSDIYNRINTLSSNMTAVDRLVGLEKMNKDIMCYFLMHVDRCVKSIVSLLLDIISIENILKTNFTKYKDKLLLLENNICTLCKNMISRDVMDELTLTVPDLNTVLELPEYIEKALDSVEEPVAKDDKTSDECVIELDKNQSKFITFVLNSRDPITSTFSFEHVTVPAYKLYDIIDELTK